MSKSKFKATDKGFKEVDDEEIKETLPTKAEEKEIEKLVEEKEEKKAPKIPVEQDLSIPYSDLGYTVSQIAGFPEHKRLACLGPEKNKEFRKKYL